MDIITSISNPQVKHLIQLQKKSKLRSEERVFLVEGLRMFAEVPTRIVDKIYISKSLFEKKGKELNVSKYNYEVLTDQVFAHISETKTPQGILCVLKQTNYNLEEILAKPNVNLLLLDNLQDPGNLGTIMRTAEGAGVTGIIMSKDCVDIYNPKTIRSTMGSIYRMPFIYVEDMIECLDFLKEHQIRIFATHLNGAYDYDQQKYSGNIAFLVGNEGNGLREEIACKADMRIKIPMEGKVESLNAAIATAIIIYEAYRQRR